MECTPTSIDGIVYNHIIKTLFGECVYGYKETISLLFGYASILCWLNAQLPQVIENYKRSSAESLSLPFLMIWLTGDVSNLVGCILTDQLAFQKYLGIYFVWVDFTLLIQWVYYTYIKEPTIMSVQEDYIPNSMLPDTKIPYQKASDTRPVSIPRNFYHSETASSEQSPLLTISDGELSPPYSASASPSKWYTLGEMTPPKRSSPRIILSAIFMLSLRTRGASVLSTSEVAPSMLKIDQVLIGRMFAWLCAALYLASRVPQILKNLQRKSIEGLSSALFIFAALGNVTYTLSISTSSAMQTPSRVIEAIPYLLGSIGTLIFDVMIFGQFIWYRRKGTIINPAVSV